MIQSSAISSYHAARLRQADFEFRPWSAGIGGGLCDRKLKYIFNIYQESYVPVFVDAKMKQRMVIVVLGFITAARA